jgi:thiosulfate dehydrogenase [quinone] large subunit
MLNLSKSQKTAVAVLRILLGWLFFYAGITKILDASWTATGFLESAKTFSGFYSFLAHPLLIGLVNVANEWGLMLIGLALIFGFWLRIASLLGAIMMLLYYFAANSLPLVPNGFLVDQHIIYAAALLVLRYLNAGLYFGLDGWKVARSVE